MLREFKEKRERLLEVYDELERYKFAPTDVIEKWKKQLKKEEFIVSFCGQIKAGKSTLLNALIFRKPILPVKVTPHTAKLTLIKYGEVPSFTVRFYSRQEWNKLIEELKKQKYEDGKNYYDKYLKNEISKRITQFGIYLDAVLEKEKEGLDLKDLNDFVGADGRYTPFVKDIVIYYPNPILKDLTIVDTPGTNDPNPFRSRETLKWIRESNAVVYVVYAGQAFTEQDIQFINDYLLTVPSDLMVFAVNKIDTVENLQEIRAWVEEVKKEERLRIRKIMADSKSVVFVSAMGGLIERMLEDCEKEDIEADDCIPKELEEKADELYLKDFTKEEKHGLSRLEKVIEDKLIKAKGLNILCSHKRNVEGVIEEKIRELISEINLNQERLKLLNSDVLKIQEELEKTKNSLKELENFINKFEKEIEESIFKIIRKFQGELELQFKRTEKFLESELKKFTLRTIDYDAIPGEVFYLLKNEIEDLLGINKNKEIFDKLLNNLGIEVEKLYNGIFEQDFIPSDMKSIFPVNTIILKVLRQVREEATMALKDVYSKLLELKEKYTHTFWFIPFRDKGDRNMLISDMKIEVGNILKELSQKFLNRLEGSIREEIKSVLNPILREVEYRLLERKETLEDLKKGLKNKELEKKKVETKIDSAKVKLEEVERIKDILLQKIELEC